MALFQAKSGVFSQNYLASRGVLLHNAGAMTHATDVTGELLKAVSRSFYLTIRFLPEEMRPGVALGYMLARATDSVADNSSSSLDERAEVLRRMAIVINGAATDEEKQDLLEILRVKMADSLHHKAESTLLCEFGACLRALDTFDEAQKSHIRKVLDTIIRGQLWDLTAFAERDTVQDDEETRRYTYSVAGCVGEFWTDLGYTTMGARFCDESRREVMTLAGVRYGQGLQLINILRDMEEDAARGRRYLCSDPHKWLNRAESYMNDGIDYSRRLGTFKLRFASMLPAIIGKKTIQLLRSVPLGKGKVKIKRSAVYGGMIQALWMSLFKRSTADA